MRPDPKTSADRQTGSASPLGRPGASARRFAPWRPEAGSGAVLRVIGTEAAGGVAITVAVVAALVWANLSPSSYTTAWEQPVHLAALPPALFGTTRQWIDNGLMVVFFLAVGLEVGRERTMGSLRDNRNAVLPVVAAMGGMAGAALVYVATSTAGPPQVAGGWGIPMATDVAFTLGVMALLGRRVPSALRVFVLALAVADDVASVAVLAVVSSSGVRWTAAVAAAVALAGVVLLRRAGVGAWWPYALGVVAVWLSLAWAGIEPTLAGAFVGMLVPCVPRPGRVDVDRTWVGPSGRMEAVAAPVATFVVVPLFALANAGVVVDHRLLASPGPRAVVVAVVVARLFGKPGGILVGVAVACLVGRIGLPDGASWRQVASAALLCGMGFTVPLLFATVAFAGHADLVGGAQVGLLVGTALAGILGSLALVATTHRPPTDRQFRNPPRSIHGEP